MVWKLNSASSRPWLISGWYGVYAVYQAGFSRMLRWITAGRIVPEYPWPISEVKTWFWRASSAICAIASVSLSGLPRSSGVVCRIEAGSVSDINASTLLAPTVSSIAVTSRADGPMWRRTKVAVSPLDLRCAVIMGPR